jgi:hypothetical protein
LNTQTILKAHAVLSTIAILALIAVVAAGRSTTQTFDTITTRHIDILDSEDRVRVQLAGEFSPRRKDLSGILFHNEDGNEAGGLVYSGKKDEDGNIQAVGMLTFDQYAEDQIMTLQYSHQGDQKRNGLLLMDRPDEMGENMLAFYKAFAEAETDEERQRLREEVLPTVPPEELPARRLFVGRTLRNSSTINLYDPLGRVRLKLEVDSEGLPVIEFLDENGESVKRISLESEIEG